MSAASGSFAAKAGFNQSGGGYYITTAAVPGATILFVTSPQTGSGGASAPPTLSSATGATTYSQLNGPSSISTNLSAAGKVIRDMGKTIVSSSRVFRKFQVTWPANLSTGGVGGAVGNGSSGASISAGDYGYQDFYLEVTQGGAPGAVPPIARTYF